MNGALARNAKVQKSVIINLSFNISDYVLDFQLAKDSNRFPFFLSLSCHLS